MPITIEQLLARTAFRSIDVEEVLDPAGPSWVRFDPELGYVPSDIVMRDGMDFSYSTYRHAPEGHRALVNYADRPCRMNTYGDSFTQCQQVSDGETWQEYLAGHLGEPIRNYGSGGYGVNTAWRRCRRIESGTTSAENILLNIFDDDHIRNLDAARWIRTAWYERERPPDRALPLHGLPWAHLRYDPDKGDFIECEGLCRNAQELRALTDPKTFYDTFHDDQIARLFVIQQGGEARRDDLETLAEAFGLKLDLRDAGTRQTHAERLHRVYGARSTQWLLTRIREWARVNQKRILLLLSYSLGTLGSYLHGDARFDQEFVDWLDAERFEYVDSLKLHAEDFSAFKIQLPAYIKRYYVDAAGAAVFGHYTPAGNHFFAYGIKNELVNWLEPKPEPYRVHASQSDRHL